MVTFSNFCSVALVFSLQATSLHAAKSSTRSRGLASIDGDQRCIANNPSKYEVFNHGAWIQMPLAGGTKCCPHVDHSTKIIMQNVALACPPITNDGGCDPDEDVVIADFEQWRDETGYWIGEYSFYGPDGSPNVSASWPYPYGSYKGFITGNVER